MHKYTNNEKCEACGNKCKDCECCLEYTNIKDCSVEYKCLCYIKRLMKF